MTCISTNQNALNFKISRENLRFQAIFFPFKEQSCYTALLKIDGFEILIGSNIGSIISSKTCSNVLVWNLANISLISSSFFKIFLLNIGLISIYKIPPCLPCYLIRALSNLTWNIWKFGSSPYWPPGWYVFSICKWGGSDITALFAYKNEHKAPCRPVWRIGKNLNFLPLISQRSYQITSQARWHPLVTDKTLLQ